MPCPGHLPAQAGRRAALTSGSPPAGSTLAGQFLPRLTTGHRGLRQAAPPAYRDRRPVMPAAGAVIAGPASATISPWP
jgi:hypothetical protein